MKVKVFVFYLYTFIDCDPCGNSSDILENVHRAFRRKYSDNTERYDQKTVDTAYNTNHESKNICTCAVFLLAEQKKGARKCYRETEYVAK